MQEGDYAYIHQSTTVTWDGGLVQEEGSCILQQTGPHAGRQLLYEVGTQLATHHAEYSENCIYSIFEETE